MFDLEHELREWAKRFGRLEVMCNTDVEELEQHVRDSIVRLTSKGLTEEEAFLIASRRVGEPIAVGQEFGKVNGGYAWARRVFSMPAGLVVFMIANIVGFCAIAWVLEAQFDQLERRVGPLRAALDEQFVVDQYAFSPGQSRLYAPLDAYDSVDDFISEYESTFLIRSITSSHGEREQQLLLR